MTGSTPIVVWIAGGAVVAFFIIGMTKNSQLRAFEATKEVPLSSRSASEVADQKLEFSNNEFRRRYNRGLNPDRAIVRRGIFGIPKVIFDTRDSASIDVSYLPNFPTPFRTPDNS